MTAYTPIPAMTVPPVIRVQETREMREIDQLVIELEKLKRWLSSAERARVNMTNLSGEPKLEWQRLYMFNCDEAERQRCETLKAAYAWCDIDAVHDAYIEQCNQAGVL